MRRRRIRTLSESRRRQVPLPPADLARWAEGLHADGADGLPLRGAVFTIEQLERHARTLAQRHRTNGRRGDDRLLRRLSESERLIARCHELLSGAHAAGRRLTPAAEWLLDNHYLIEEQIDLARKHFPPGYSRRLPRLEDRGETAGLPRVYDLVREFVAHVDGRVDEEALRRYVTAYQTVTPLTLGELWSVAIMLRLALVETLRHVAVTTAWQRAHRDLALAWAQRIDAASDQHESALLVLADMVRELPPLTPAFVAQFTQALQGRGANTSFVLAWLEQRLSERGQTVEHVVRADSQGQAAAQAAMANSIASLRLVGATEWHAFVEAHSATERILRGEPAGVYARMDFATRDVYRHVVEAAARRLHADEQEVARTAVSLAAERHAADPADAAAHVGHVLVDDGRRQLDRALRGRVAARRFARGRRARRLLGYLGPVAALSVAGVTGLVLLAGAAPGLAWPVLLPLLVVCAAVAASQFAIAAVNWVAALVRPPRATLRMDYEHGIPDECRTIVVVPTLLAGGGASGRERVAALLEGLELRYLANRDPNLWFGLLTDFGDAPTEHLPEDAELLALAAAGIEELNGTYGDAHARFFLFHRPRIHNPAEGPPAGCWMGRERKRGKLEDFNALLCGQNGSHFSRIVGDTAELGSIRYVITLDTDTDLPWGAGWRLVGAAAHPLNRPVMDAAGRRLVRGYAILQPRVGSSLRSAVRSRYARMLAGEVGLDPYTGVVSDLYQDLFGETSFIGKGIYDVGAFRRLLEGRFPDNAVLSHDLLESCYARAGQCSDVELLEDSPSGYLADVSRRHRWMRGDWQVAPWLGLRVGDAAGRRARPALTVLGWWKIFDNLRRAFVAPAYATLLVLGWLALPTPVAWTLAVLSLLFVPELLPGLAELGQRPPKLPLRPHVATVARSTGRRLAKIALWLTFLPFEALVAVDAAGRSLWRMTVSRRRLLEWQTAAAVERSATASFPHVLRRMAAAPVLAAAVLALTLLLGAATAPLAAAPILLAWLVSPLVAWWVSRPLARGPTPLGEGDRRYLRRIARLTWRYFEVFAGAQENWLPHDNFQEHPGHRVARRTSPTDMGLGLLSNLAAHDLGYLSGGQLLDRTHRALESMEQLERHRGHFLNWYDTATRKPLRPFYVSTVDSGNLVGHVRVLRSGLLELPGGPVLPAGAVAGLRDTLWALVEQVPSGVALAPVLAEIDALLAAPPPDSLVAKAAWLDRLGAAAARLAGSVDRQQHPEPSWWANAFDRQVRALRADLTELAPWLDLPAATPPAGAGAAPPWRDDLDRAPSLAALGERARAAALAATPDGDGELRAAVEAGAERVAARLRQIAALATRCALLTDAEFAFLYDPRRKLLAIGYWVTERRLDNSFYDLLASEARFASYLSIAAGTLPFDHWFALGRRLTTAKGHRCC